MTQTVSISRYVSAILVLILFVGTANLQAVDVDRDPLPVNSVTPPDNIDDRDLEGIRANNLQRLGPRRDDPVVEGSFLLVHGVYATRDNWWGDIEDIFSDNDLDYDRITDPADLDDIDLDQYDVVWVGDYQTDAWNTVYNNYRSYIDDWVWSCGVLYHCTGTNNFGVTPIHPGGLTKINDAYPGYLVSTAYTAVPQDECLFFDLLDWDLNTHLTGNYFSHTRYAEDEIADVAVGGDYQILVDDDGDGDGSPLVARYGYGFGQVVVTGTTDAFAIKYSQSWSAIDPDMFRYLMSLTGPTDAAGMIPILIDVIGDWRDKGQLDWMQGHLLTNILQFALFYYNYGNTQYAISCLGYFCNRVTALVSWGLLSEEEGAALIHLCNEILASLGEEGDALDDLLLTVGEYLPDFFTLYEAYPNPFNSTTTISYCLPFESQVSLTVYDVSGRRVATLVNGYQQPGIHSAVMGSDNLATGMYIVRLEAGGRAFTQKVMLVR